MSNTFNIKRTETNGDGVALNNVAHPRPKSKIDLIIAALNKTKLLFEAHGQYPHTLREVNEALTAARELKALEPVAIRNPINGIIEIQWGASESVPLGTKLYALDEVTK
jgi:hypothetical protein